MQPLRFEKSFTQQEGLSEDIIARAVEVMRGGRLHRYNVAPGEVGEVTLLEEEYAAYQGAAYCLATTSGGTAMQIALRAVGIKAGETVLTNAFTLAPVPGAIAATGGVPVFVETTENLTIDLDDLDAKLTATGARIVMLSHMRGHLAPMDTLAEIIARHGATMIEDCAHTMGAAWDGTKSGNFGRVACFSTQTYKHMNSGEGGFLTTDDPEVMARAVILSGSYMLYERHKARPDMAAFKAARLEMPNCSSRLDNLRAAILRPQLPQLETNIDRWNARYAAVHDRLASVEGLTQPHRSNRGRFVGSSLQFLVPAWEDQQVRDFVAACAGRGVELKWFGDANPVGFTSRYDSWTYAPKQSLDRSVGVLKRVIDMRIPLSFSVEDCSLIADIIAEEFTNAVASS